MTTVITRLYGDQGSAQGVRERLYRVGFPRYQLSLISAREGDDEEAVKARMVQALVPAEAAVAYASRVAEGASLVVVRATYKPLGAVRIANETFDSSGALPVNLPSQSFKVKAPRDHAPSILKDHPRFFTVAPSGGPERQTVSDQLGVRLLSPQKRRDSAMTNPKRIFGEGISRKERKLSTNRREHLSKVFWPMPLLSKRKRRSAVIEGGGHPFSRALGWPTTS